jgi:hypothetical protein
VATVSAALLTGCDPGGFPIRPDTPAPINPGTPTAAPHDPRLDADTLFVITASTTDEHGNAVELTMVGHAAQSWDAPGREAVKSTFIDQCSALGGGTAMAPDTVVDESTLAANGSSLMVIDVSSAPAATTLVGGVELLLGDPAFSVVTAGDGLSNPYAFACYGGYQISSTGTVSAIVNYETGSPEPDLSQWRSGRYGFTAAYGSPAVLSECSVALTTLAIDSGVGDVDGWYPDGGTDTECAIGYRGE